MGTIRYDGLARRIVKQAGDGSSSTREAGDFEPQAPLGPKVPSGMTYHLYHDGQRIVEERNGSNLVIRQYVPQGPQAVWGRDYVDELCQAVRPSGAEGPFGIGINDDPADADRRWDKRTRFGEHMPRFYKDTEWHAEFSDRCAKSHRAMAPMYRARQRAKLAQFAHWSAQKGMPLITTESWASWYYIDSPNLDWGWLLECANWSVEDAIDMRMWGWTPHNYCQPQFAN